MPSTPKSPFADAPSATFSRCVPINLEARALRDDARNTSRLVRNHMPVCLQTQAPMSKLVMSPELYERMLEYAVLFGRVVECHVNGPLPFWSCERWLDLLAQPFMQRVEWIGCYAGHCDRRMEPTIQRALFALPALTSLDCITVENEFPLLRDAMENAKEWCFGRFQVLDQAAFSALRFAPALHTIELGGWRSIPLQQHIAGLPRTLTSLTLIDFNLEDETINSADHIRELLCCSPGLRVFRAEGMPILPILQGLLSAGCDVLQQLRRVELFRLEGSLFDDTGDVMQNLRRHMARVLSEFATITVGVALSEEALPEHALLFIYQLAGWGSRLSLHPKPFLGPPAADVILIGPGASTAQSGSSSQSQRADSNGGHNESWAS